MPETGTPGSDDLGSLQCVQPDGGASIPTLHEDGDLKWRQVQLSSEVLETTWALVILPSDGRQAYAEGLPVVVNVLVDTHPDKDYLTAPKPLVDPDLGILEVQALPPGWSALDATTSGGLNYQGALSQEAVRAAILWASGQQHSLDGLSLADVAEHTVCGEQLIVAGTSASGTTAVGALHPDRSSAVESLGGLDLFEAPTHPQLLAREGGLTLLDFDHEQDADGNGFTWDDSRNLSYLPEGCDLQTCALDYSSLRYLEGMSAYELWPDHVNIHLPGLMYLDQNGNGTLDLGKDGTPDIDGSGSFDASEDFVMLGRVLNDEWLSFSPELIAAAQTLGLFDEEAWPDFVPTPAQTQEWWSERSMITNLRALAAAWPTGSQASVSYSEIDHGVPLPSRPHVAVSTQLFLDQGVDVQLNAPREVAVCVLGSAQASAWIDPPSLTETIVETDLFRWAIPEDISPSSLRTTSIVGLLWEIFGPIQTCQAISTEGKPSP